jgi:hypothetical protein
MTDTYAPKTYRTDGGDRHVIASSGSLDVESGGELDIESGGALKLAGTALTATAAELNLSDNLPASVSFVAAAGGANECDVTITVLDAAGVAIAEAFPVLVWLSDADTGATLTTTGASGTVQAKSSSGDDFGVLTAKKALIAQTLATGIYTLEITDSAKTTFYVCAQCPGTGHVFVSTILATGDYGS